MDQSLPLEVTLLPAFFECFGIMFLGYILGKFQVLGQNEIKGLSKFVQYLALPALIFVMLSTLPLNAVKWEFIASVLVTKTCIFACVVLMTILLTHPPDLGKAGIYAIAVTQSNDFALAYPMFLSVYDNSHTDYPSYVYIVAPIQLVILNTIGFFIIETHKQNFDETANCHVWKIIKGTLKNPIVFMTIVGILWNICFGHKILPILNTLLQTLSRAFPATALLLVGHTMAIKGGKTDKHIPITVALLVITKNLILPIILQKFSAFMLQNSNESEIQSFSNFGFLYGTVPTAPSVYVFAAQYGVAIDVVTKTIIGSTLLSAPLMFASASVISISQIGLKNMPFYQSLTISYLSLASLVCCGWLLLSFFIGKRFRNLRFAVTFYIIFSQFLTSVGGLLLFFSQPNYSVIFYAQYILSIGGLYATRICTLFLAILLIVIRWRSLCYILQIKKHINFISVLCLILPYIIAALALISKNIKYDGPNCQMGNVQTITTFALTLFCLIGTILCLILQHICFRKSSNSEINIQKTTYQTIGESEHMPQTSTDVKKPLIRSSSEDEISVDVEDLGTHFENLLQDSENKFSDCIENDLCDSRYQCSVEKRLQCATNVSSYRKEQEEIGLYDDKDIFKHTTVLISLSVAMTLSLAVSFWKLIMEEIDGIFIELQFLDIIINYSLGILLFFVFGFNKGLLNTISNRWKMLIHGNINTMEATSTDICQEFKEKYEHKFRMDMYNFKREKFVKLFSSSDLSDWLIENGAISTRDEAETYILNLEKGQVIYKVDNSIYFPEDKSIFKLTDSSD